MMYNKSYPFTFCKPTYRNTMIVIIPPSYCMDSTALVHRQQNILLKGGAA